MRITIRHHKAWQAMTKGDQRDSFFHSILKLIMDSFTSLVFTVCQRACIPKEYIILIYIIEQDSD